MQAQCKLYWGDQFHEKLGTTWIISGRKYYKYGSVWDYSSYVYIKDTVTNSKIVNFKPHNCLNVKLGSHSSYHNTNGCDNGNYIWACDSNDSYFREIQISTKYKYFNDF